jgi:hypothetical protein
VNVDGLKDNERKEEGLWRSVNNYEDMVKR